MADKKEISKRALFEDQILKILNESLRGGFSNPLMVFVTIVRVELNEDYSIAKAFWSTFDETKRGDLKEVMSKVAPKMRGILAREMKVRHVPQVQLYYHGQAEAEREIDALLEKEKHQFDEE